MPLLIAVARDSPGRFLQLQDVLLHIAIELAGDNVADLEPASLLIEKAEADDDRHVGAVLSANLLNEMTFWAVSAWLE